jgi:hypothetical protein
MRGVWEVDYYGFRAPADPVYITSLDLRVIAPTAIADDIRDLQIGATHGARARYYHAGRSITETAAAFLIADRLAETAQDLIEYVDWFNGTPAIPETELREWAQLLENTADSIRSYPSVQRAMLKQLASVIPPPSLSTAMDRYRDSLTAPGFISAAALAADALGWQERTGQSLGLTAKPDGTVLGARTLAHQLALPPARRRVNGQVVRGYLIP